MMKAELNTGFFSGGGAGTYTYTHNMQHLVPGFTNVQASRYVFMDGQ